MIKNSSNLARYKIQTFSTYVSFIIGIGTFFKIISKKL